MAFDTESGLPYGFGFDDFIFTKTIYGLNVSGENETFCTHLMTELIEKLGYLDY